MYSRFGKTINFNTFNSLISIGKHDVSSASLTLRGFLPISKYSKLNKLPIADGIDLKLFPHRINFRNSVSKIIKQII